MRMAKYPKMSRVDAGSALRLLDEVSENLRMGVTILPPVPAFYNRPGSVDDIVNHIVMRILDQFGISMDLAKRWDGEMGNRTANVRPIKANEI